MVRVVNAFIKSFSSTPSCLALLIALDVLVISQESKLLTVVAMGRGSNQRERERNETKMFTRVTHGGFIASALRVRRELGEREKVERLMRKWN